MRRADGHRLQAVALYGVLSVGLAACGSSSTSTAKATDAPATASSSPSDVATPSDTPSSASSGATITSVAVTGTVASPTVTVAGTGFGAQPSPDPTSVPQGQQGCPPAPEAGDGHLFGTHLYFTDVKAKAGGDSWTAGEFTPGGNGQFDCVGLIIKSWTPTKVVFGFGNLYGKMIPMNYYTLSNGDPIEVFVQGAHLAGTATLT